MPFHTVLVSAILPPRRQWCHLHISRGAVRKQNFHSTPNCRPVVDVVRAVAGARKLRLWGAAETCNGNFCRSYRKKATKAQLSRAIKQRRGAKWGVAPLNFRLNSVRLSDWLGAAKNAAANKCSPELGSAVSGVVENLSRKIHIQTTKSYAYGVESVYLLWWVS